MTSKFTFSVSILFFVSLLLLSASSFSQSTNISGKISGTGDEPLTGATAELRNAKDSSLAKVNAADGKGMFSFENVKAGNYFLKASLLGYNPWMGSVFSYEGTESKELPEIKMTSSSVTLKQAEISAIKPLVEVKADKTVFNVENSINSTGSTAYELLQKAPGVVVDNNDNILLKGRGGVMVQIDGRPSHLSETELADYLKSIQSTDVESIELISNPSSKYDAEGTAGIINIKLKKNKNYGTNGSATLGYAIGKYSKYNTALSLNNRSKKFNVYSNYSNNWGERGNEFYLYREQNPYIFNQSSVSKRSGLSHNYKAGVDYTLNKKNGLGVMINGNYSNTKGKQTNRNTISDFITHFPDSILKSDQANTNRGNNFNLNLNHHFTDTLGHELTTDFDFGYYDGSRNSYIPNVYTLPDYETPLSSSFFRSVTPTTITIYTLKSDYSQNFLKGKLGAGFKTSFVNTDNTFNFYNIIDNVETIDNTRSNHFVYTENVNALYLNYQRTVKKFDFQAGIRMENTVSEGDLKSSTAAEDKNVKRNYTDLFPSGGITFNPHKNHALALVYSSRIDRPNYQELNPFEYKLDELSFSKGNPFLDPQYSNKIELSHTYKYTTTTSIGYSRTTDFFAKITDTIPGGKSFLTSRNLATEDVLSVNVSTSLQPLKWYSIYFNGGIYNQAYDADFGNNKTINTSFTSFNMYAQNTFKLPYSFTFELSGWYNSGGVWGGSYKTDGQGSLDVGLQKKLLGDQATLKFSYSDILHTAPWNSYNTYAGIVSRAWGNWESQQFRASLTWRFGNKQMKNIRQRTTGSESEQKRIGGGD
ncbi:MAG TPA: TonB-dependent receptor [Bacteroidia bacterium]|nr:TonB-dependent receptor [Bacteroidia bacterium]